MQLFSEKPGFVGCANQQAAHLSRTMRFTLFTTAWMQEVGQCMEQLPTTAWMQEVGQCMEQLPTTAWMQEVGQCMEQLPTTAWMQEVGGKMLLHFPHSPHPCGLATQGAVAELILQGIGYNKKLP